MFGGQCFTRRHRLRGLDVAGSTRQHFELTCVDLAKWLHPTSSPDPVIVKMDIEGTDLTWCRTSLRTRRPHGQTSCSWSATTGAWGKKPHTYQDALGFSQLQEAGIWMHEWFLNFELDLFDVYNSTPRGRHRASLSSFAAGRHNQSWRLLRGHDMDMYMLAMLSYPCGAGCGRRGWG